MINSCGALEVVGGHPEIDNSEAFEIYYSGLKPHNKLRLTFDVLLVDWEGPNTEVLIIDVDGTEID